MRRTAAALSLALSIGSGAALAAEAPEGAVFNIMGPSTCAAWPKAGKIESAAKAVPLNWVLGFASGEAELSDPRVLDLLAPDKVDAWLDVYCPVHPTDALPKASRVLIAELKAGLPPLAPPPPASPMFVPPVATPAKPPAKKPPVRRPAARKPAAAAK